MNATPRTPRTALGRALGLATAALVALACTLPRAAPAQDAGLLVIVRTTSAIRAATWNEVRAVFGGRARAIGGTTVVPLNLPPNDPARRSFDRAVLGLDPDRVARYWIDARIRDGSQPPRTVPNVATMVRAVAALPNGIGYTLPGTDLTGVKVIGRVQNGRMEAP